MQIQLINWIPILGLLTGCGLVDVARMSVNEPLNMREVAFIKLGQTTLPELVAILGTPDEIKGSEEGAIAIYHFLDAKYSRVNYGLAASAWSPVTPDLITEGLRMGLDRFEVHLDQTWHIHRIELAHQHEDRRGFNLWPFVDESKIAESR